MTWEYNLHGTKEVVKFAHAHAAKLVYAGSSSKFGNDGQDENLNPYAWTKAKNVEYIRNFAQLVRPRLRHHVLLQRVRPGPDHATAGTPP